MISNKKYFFIFSTIAIAAALFIFLRSQHKARHRYPNVMLIVVDALRPDHLGCYGYPRNTSPNIDFLAKQGVRFSEAISAAGWTGESVASILTGTYPPIHQVRVPSDTRNPAIETLAQRLRPHGYYCMFWANHRVAEKVDVKDGFQEVFLGSGVALDSQELTRKMVARISAIKNKAPFFLYVHYYGPHAPYRPLPPYKDRYLNDQYRERPKAVPICNSFPKDEDYKGKGCLPSLVAENNITDINYYIAQYDAAIAYSDAQLGMLMEGLKNIGLDKNTMIIITADHGELLGEHEIYFNHAGGYEGGYDENIKVPLVIKFPRPSVKNAVFSEEVSLIDVAPTVLEEIGLDKPPYMQGASLLALLSPVKAYLNKYHFCFFSGDWLVLRSKQWKLVRNYIFKTWKLYNLEKDPLEDRNLVKTNPLDFERLRDLFNQRLQEMSSLTTVSGEDFALTDKNGELLKSLQYNQ